MFPKYHPINATKFNFLHYTNIELVLKLFWSVTKWFNTLCWGNILFLTRKIIFLVLIKKLLNTALCTWLWKFFKIFNLADFIVMRTRAITHASTVKFVSTHRAWFQIHLKPLRHEVEDLSLAICNSRRGWHPRYGPIMTRGSQQIVKKILYSFKTEIEFRKMLLEFIIGIFDKDIRFKKMDCLQLLHSCEYDTNNKIWRLENIQTKIIH